MISGLVAQLIAFCLFLSLSFFLSLSLSLSLWAVERYVLALHNAVLPETRPLSTPGSPRDHPLLFPPPRSSYPAGRLDTDEHHNVDLLTCTTLLQLLANCTSLNTGQRVQFSIVVLSRSRSRLEFEFNLSV